MPGSIPLLDNLPPYKSTPGVRCFVLFFELHFITDGTLTTTPPAEERLKAAQNAKEIKPGGHNLWPTSTRMDTGTELQAITPPHYTEPITGVTITNQRDCHGVTEAEVFFSEFELERKASHQNVVGHRFGETGPLRCNPPEFHRRMWYRIPVTALHISARRYFRGHPWVSAMTLLPINTHENLTKPTRGHNKCITHKNSRNPDGKKQTGKTTPSWKTSSPRNPIESRV